MRASGTLRQPRERRNGIAAQDRLVVSTQTIENATAPKKLDALLLWV
jgi:hypothetical protein